MLKNLSLKTQLFGGFGMIGLIVLALVGVGLYSAITSRGNFTEYRSTARTSLALAETQDGVATLRNAAFSFRVTPSAGNRGRVQDAQSALEASITSSIDLITDPGMAQDKQQIRQLASEYADAFDRYSQTRLALEIEAERLRAAGRDLRTEMGDAMGISEMLGAQQVLLNLADARQSLMLGRYYGRSAIEKANGADADRSRGEFSDMVELMRGVVSSAPDALQQLATDLSLASEELLSDYDAAMTRSLEIDSIAVEELDRIGPEMAEVVDRLVASNVALQDRIGPQIDAAFEGQRNFTIVLGLAGALIAIAAAAILMSVILRNLGAVVNGIARVRQGEYEFKVRGVERKDELGDLFRAVEDLRTGEINRIRMEKEALAATQEREARSKATHDAIDIFRNKVETILKILAERTHEMRHTAGRLNSQATFANEQAKTADGAAGETANSVETVAAAAEELSSSIQEIARLTESASHKVSDAGQRSQSSVDQIEALADRVSSINDVIDLINDIAEQTNLLALNATIEAARAGDAGKGFAVVASEVKDLAEQTSKATDTVASLVKDIQSSMTGSVDSIRGIAKMSEEINEATASIASAIEEQGAATREISQSTTRAAESTTTLAKGVRDVGEAVAETESAAGLLETTSDAFTSQSDTLREAVEMFFEAIKEGPLNRREGENPDYSGPERRKSRRGEVEIPDAA